MLHKVIYIHITLLANPGNSLDIAVRIEEQIIFLIFRLTYRPNV